ncbi:MULTISPECIES: CDP-alcohol phosphatidyltransferase family protein [Mesorhizobium]|uniref:CDP-alcohol phosphatidyltransferase family protein n=1 Tax=Mesorhizobium denitrificans TaxID=2294114 RepID=A0A371XF80_9HYPH|nr:MULTISPECIES: CDP-alcohol phosphatidyltransferase family protein [Mesorhizobium]RFC67890.1 CDP-alcohol phosphatidyltransferase family protein [Mesorhizobium denitrificans]
MPTLYDVKPAFQGKLRPLTSRLAVAGITANQVTITAALISVVAGAAMAIWPANALVFLLLPLVLFIRMALNAIDGMLAREHGQASRLGLVLNEVCDVVSDLALILPFAAVPLFPAWGVVAFALTAFLTEFVGLLGVPLGSTRRYDGPFGKSDRAFALGLIAVLLVFHVPIGVVAPYIFPALALLSLVTVANRVRVALADVR